MRSMYMREFYYFDVHEDSVRCKVSGMIMSKFKNLEGTIAIQGLRIQNALYAHDSCAF